MALLVDERVVAVPGPIAVLVAVRVRVDLAVQVAVGRVEAVLPRPDLGPQTQVPLAEQRRDVAARLEHVRPGWASLGSGGLLRPAIGPWMPNRLGLRPVSSAARVGEQVG